MVTAHIGELTGRLPGAVVVSGRRQAVRSTKRKRGK
jgi:hypothetical protein